MRIDFKQNVVRIWQKIAESEDGYQNNLQDMDEKEKHQLEIEEIRIKGRLMKEVEDKMNSKEVPD